MEMFNNLEMRIKRFVIWFFGLSILIIIYKLSIIESDVEKLQFLKETLFLNKEQLQLSHHQLLLVEHLYQNKVGGGLPTIYAITPTYYRHVQKAELTRISQTLALVPNIHWIVVEDSEEKTDLVRRILNDSNIIFTHLNAKTPPFEQLKDKDPRWKKHRGVEQRNAGLKWVRDHLKVNEDKGVVYFMDDDNTYSIKLFKEISKVKRCEGYVGCAVNANVYRFYQAADGTYNVDKVIDVKQLKVEGGDWPMEYMQGFNSEIIISLDDKYLYLNNWFQGDVRQYDITDRANPVLTGQVYLGGMLQSDSPIKVVDDDTFVPPEPVIIKGKRLHGGPQMFQLSLDAKRLYVSNSLYSVWDKQFYPQAVQEGGWIVKIDVDHENGGMTLDRDFIVDFGNTPHGPILAHEMRYPGGDCTSDIWLAK